MGAAAASGHIQIMRYLAFTQVYAFSGLYANVLHSLQQLFVFSFIPDPLPSTPYYYPHSSSIFFRSQLGRKERGLILLESQVGAQ